MEASFNGKGALLKIKAKGLKRKQVGLHIKCAPLSGPNTTFWSITNTGIPVGKVTSAIYAPRLEKNIALAMVSIESANIGTQLQIEMGLEKVPAIVVEKPFYDPKKKITSKI
jgi:aminomethyltransferase